MAMTVVAMTPFTGHAAGRRKMIGVLGVGHFGSALVSGFVRSGVPARDILVSPRGRAAKLVVSDYGVDTAGSNEELVFRTEVVLLSVRPLDACEAIASLPWRPDQLLISVCAGIPLKQLQSAAGQSAEIVRAMPMTSVAINASPTVMFPNSARAAELLKRLGSVIPLENERQFEVATAISLAYALSQVLIGQTEQWARENEIGGSLGRVLASAYFESGARLMAAERETPIEKLVSALATKGGLTEMALCSLRAGRFEETWREAFDAGLNRVRSLCVKG